MFQKEARKINKRKREREKKKMMIFFFFYKNAEEEKFQWRSKVVHRDSMFFSCAYMYLIYCKQRPYAISEPTILKLVELTLVSMAN